MSDKIIIGRFGSSHGIAGWIKVISFTEPPENILQYPHCFINQHNTWHPLVISQYQTHGKTILAKIPGCDTPEQARQYTNQDIAIVRDELPKLEPDTFYWHDLEGLDVINTDNIEFGKIDHILATGSNDVLVIKGERERLVPYINNVIISVDLKAKLMVVNWDAEF